ncbi:hypothetical protein T492DRAFT_1079345 [Pavlovales sp. CCMP2436]|nr:hypothetical protein T492DRAFT_1079345 [Pavlovales sp. CCMP2436]|mmetsp:Transcript_25557/g.64948  ORF Transcript_25557/g.64948 Transcript_25557/m.64948 type:complete len:168 (+) Transcript_25557:82-585(+)
MEGFSSPVVQPPAAVSVGKRRQREDGGDETAQATVKLPAKAMLYLECSDAEQWERYTDNLTDSMPLEFSARAPWPLQEGARVIEVTLVRTAHVALVRSSDEPGLDPAVLEAQGIDGWQETSTDRLVLLHGKLLRLIDADKRPGLSQALISDMFKVMSIGQGGASSRR